MAGTDLVAHTAYAFDGASRLTDLTHSKGATTFADDDWAYDQANRLTQLSFTSLVGTDGTSDYAYDDHGQLIDADHDYQADEDYSYDENGNRTNSGYATGDHNRLTSDGTYDYEYDAEGNRTRRTHIANDTVTVYGWDHRNRLVSITEYDSSSDADSETDPTKVVEYEYDVYDRRLTKEIDNDGDGTTEATERYVYDGDHILLRFDGDGASDLSNRYLHGPAVDQVFADESVDSLFSAGDIFWPLTDNQGTVRDLVEYDAGTDATSVASHLTYDAFGNITEETAVIDHIFAYTGRERDVESDLQFNRARYYDAATGRWISEDPIGFAAGDPNLYGYVGNGPTNGIDPYGLELIAQLTQDDDGFVGVKIYELGSFSSIRKRGQFNIGRMNSADTVLIFDTQETVSLDTVRTAVSGFASRYCDVSPAAARHYVAEALSIAQKYGTLRITKAELLDTYKTIYGADDRLLKAYLAEDGKIEVADYWRDQSLTTPNTFGGELGIYIDEELSSPLLAASYLRNQLENSLEKWGEVQQRWIELGDDVCVDMRAAQRAGFRGVADYLENGADIVIAAMSIANEGADLVITVHELSEGNYKAAVGFVPFIPAAAGKGTVLIRQGDDVYEVGYKAAAEAVEAGTDLRKVGRMLSPDEIRRLELEEIKARRTTDAPSRPANSPFSESAFEARLQRGVDYPGVSDARHFQEANRQLHEFFQANSQAAQQMEQLYPGIIEGVKPGARGAFPRRAPTPDVTWHHHPNREGILELVPRSQHSAPGPVQQSLHPEGRGGMENWGGGR